MKFGVNREKYVYKHCFCYSKVSTTGTKDPLFRQPMRLWLDINDISDVNDIFPIVHFRHPIMQYVLGGSVLKDNTSYASVNCISLVSMQITPQNELFNRICENS